MAFEIKLDDVGFQEAFNTALLQTFDEKKKDELIKGAISYLMSQAGKSGYGGSNTTHLEDAFRTALRAETIEVARNFIANNTEWKTAIEGLISDAVKKITENGRDKTVDKIADKIIEGLYSEKY